MKIFPGLWMLGISVMGPELLRHDLSWSPKIFTMDIVLKMADF